MYFVATGAFSAISSISSFTTALVRPFGVLTNGICITAMGFGSALVYI